MPRHPDLPPVIIGTEDHARLQRVVRELAGQSHPLASVLDGELGRADVRRADDIPENTVTLDSFVSYRAGPSERPERRLLVLPHDSIWRDAEISVTSPLGITLIGLSAGDRMPILGSAMPTPPWVEVLSVGPGATGGIVRRPSVARAAADKIEPS